MQTKNCKCDWHNNHTPDSICPECSENCPRSADLWFKPIDDDELLDQLLRMNSRLMDDHAPTKELEEQRIELMRKLLDWYEDVRKFMADIKQRVQ